MKQQLKKDNMRYTRSELVERIKEIWDAIT